MKIVCISDRSITTGSRFASITIGKVYDAADYRSLLKEPYDVYYIKDDFALSQADDSYYYYDAVLFKPLTEIREEKIDLIIG